MYKDSVENLTQSHLLEGIYVEEDARASGRKRGTLHLMEDAFQGFANLPCRVVGSQLEGNLPNVHESHARYIGLDGGGYVS